MSAHDTKAAAHKLYVEINAARMLLTNMADILGEDSELRADMLEGSTNLNEVVDAAMRRLVELAAMRKGLGAAMEALKKRDFRFETQEDNLKTLLLEALSVAEKKRHECAYGTLSRAAVPPKVVITDESAIPGEYWKQPEPVLDKRALLAALKDLPAEGTIPGATLSNGSETIKIHLT